MKKLEPKKICTCEDNEPCTCNKKSIEIKEKSLEEKNIVERHTMSDGKFNLGNCLAEIEAINKHNIEKIVALEEAMQFFSEWYNRTQRVDILVPNNKIILSK